MKWTLKNITLWMALLIAAALLPACSTDSNSGLTDAQTSGDAPPLPEMSTMVFDLDFFGVEAPAVSEQSLVTGRPGDELQAADSANRSNWINAFVRALYLQLAMYDALEEPIGAFALAVHSVPQLQDDGSWLWTYIFVDDGVEYSIFLYGTPGDAWVDWRMEVSTNTPGFMLDHFVWFRGRTHNSDREGYWQFYDPVFKTPAQVAGTTGATPGVETVRIDWENPSRTEHRLTVTVNGAGHDDEGDYLEFFESSFVGSITHYDAGEGVTSDITYYPDGSGSLIVPDYNNGERACWDQQQFDVDCAL
jgi:hypothetical protein